MDNTIGLVILLAFPIAVVITAIRLSVRWTGGWRMAAVLPLVAIVGDLLFSYFAGVVNPAAHHLWPFELMTVTAICTVFLIAASSLRRATLEKERREGPPPA
ncbi:MAG: hypothetical protein KGL93_10740 [Gemmatimonadota bacterium]|nr:hypothetical protein [Gemmatimonadota bacterium]HEU4988426.1 hypothetical protein [Gemmatimonadaceae bacterium]